MHSSEKNDGRVALVTGGAMGIGASVGQALGAQGMTILVSDIDMAAAEKTVARFREQGIRCRSLHMDVSRPESIEAAFAEAEKEHGRCDVLVNCAGVAKVYPFLEFPLENWLATFNINVTGTMLCGQHAARLMARHRWGRIVNIASVAGMRAVGTGRTAYGSSKAAVIGLTRQMAVELAEYGITVNAVSPGPVDTPMTRVLHTDKFRQEYSAAIPMNRYGTTDEIAAAVSFLASDGAAYVTGIAMPVDGGFLSSGARGI